MDATQTLKQVSDTVTAKPFSFELGIAARNKFHRWLQQKGWAPQKRKLEIRPIVIANLLRISRLLTDINTDEMRKGNFLDSSHRAITDHAETMCRILAIAIQNNRNEPSASLIQDLKDNLTAKEMLGLVTVLLSKMDLTSFISSIISIRGLNVLESAEKPEVSPMSQER